MTTEAQMKINTIRLEILDRLTGAGYRAATFEYNWLEINGVKIHCDIQEKRRRDLGRWSREGTGAVYASVGDYGYKKLFHTKGGKFDIGRVVAYLIECYESKLHSDLITQAHRTQRELANKVVAEVQRDHGSIFKPEINTTNVGFSFSLTVRDLSSHELAHLANFVKKMKALA